MSIKSKIKRACQKRNLDFNYIWTRYPHLHKETRRELLQKLNILEVHNAKGNGIQQKGKKKLNDQLEPDAEQRNGEEVGSEQEQP